MRTDLYKVLGVSADATENEIRRAYRANALLLHPDRSNSSDSSGFRKLQEAYEVLGESGTRCEAGRLSRMLPDIAISHCLACAGASTTCCEGFSGEAQCKHAHTLPHRVAFLPVPTATHRVPFDAFYICCS